MAKATWLPQAKGSLSLCPSLPYTQTYTDTHLANLSMLHFVTEIDIFQCSHY